MPFILKGSSEAVDKEFDKYNLTAFFWQEVETYTLYNSAAPGIYDFLLDVFQRDSVHTGESQGESQCRHPAFKWKDLNPLRGPCMS
jgi:hypothetical protein